MSVFAKFSLPAATPHLAIDHVVSGFLPFMLAKIVGEVKNPVMFVARDGQSLDEIEQSLHFIKADLPVLQFPGWDCLPYDRVSPSQNVMAKRIAALSQMATLRQNPKPALILTTVNACMQKLPPSTHFDGMMLNLRPGDRLAMDILAQTGVALLTCMPQAVIPPCGLIFLAIRWKLSAVLTRPHTAQPIHINPSPYTR